VTAGHDTDVIESLTARVTHQSEGGAAHDACHHDPPSAAV